MDIIQSITIILIIILIIIIICEIINRRCDEKLWNVKYLFKKSKYKNYIIDSIGITRSITHFWPNPKSDLNSHTDIITYCHNPKNNRFYYILIYSSNYRDMPYNESINNKNIKYNAFTDIAKVKPNKHFKFKLNKYTYRITEMYNISENNLNKNINWTIDDIYNLFIELLQIPYHRLKFNCHHVANFVLDIVLNNNLKNRKHKLNKFEFDNSENYKPILYIYNYFKEQLGFKVVDRINLKKLRELFKKK